MCDHGDPQYLTLAEAAELLGVTPATLERWARAGRIPSKVGVGEERLFRRSDVTGTAAQDH